MSGGISFHEVGQQRRLPNLEEIPSFLLLSVYLSFSFLFTMSQQSSPPSYYYSETQPQTLLHGGGVSEKAPLIYPAPLETTVIYRQSPSGTTGSKKCCGVSMAICICLCVCCGCVMTILAGIFGAWAGRCASIESFRNEVLNLIS